MPFRSLREHWICLNFFMCCLIRALNQIEPFFDSRIYIITNLERPSNWSDYLGHTGQNLRGFSDRENSLPKLLQLHWVCLSWWRLCSHLTKVSVNFNFTRTKFCKLKGAMVLMIAMMKPMNRTVKLFTGRMEIKTHTPKAFHQDQSMMMFQTNFQVINQDQIWNI